MSFRGNGVCVAVDGDGGVEEIDGIGLINATVTTVAPVARVIVAGVIVIVVEAIKPVPPVAETFQVFEWVAIALKEIVHIGRELIRIGLIAIEKVENIVELSGIKTSGRLLRNGKASATRKAAARNGEARVGELAFTGEGEPSTGHGEIAGDGHVWVEGSHGWKGVRRELFWGRKKCPMNTRSPGIRTELMTVISRRCEVDHRGSEALRGKGFEVCAEEI